jgi:hypothetical protein
VQQVEKVAFPNVMEWFDNVQILCDKLLISARLEGCSVSVHAGEMAYQSLRSTGRQDYCREQLGHVFSVSYRA